MPVRNGCSPDAPAGWHSSQVGTVLELIPTALPDDPLDAAVGAVAVVDRPVDGAPLDPLLGAKPGVTVPDADPAATGVYDVVVVELAGVVAETVPVVVAPVPRVTTPFGARVPGVAEVCAAAGNATAVESNIA